jgi:hypothetical protein
VGDRRQGRGGRGGGGDEAEDDEEGEGEGPPGAGSRAGVVATRAAAPVGPAVPPSLELELKLKPQALASDLNPRPTSGPTQPPPPPTPPNPLKEYDEGEDAAAAGDQYAAGGFEDLAEDEGEEADDQGS